MSLVLNHCHRNKPHQEAEGSRRGRLSKVMHMNGRLTAYNSCTFGKSKVVCSDIVTFIQFVKPRRPLCNKATFAAVLCSTSTGVPPLRDSCGYTKTKLALAGKQKKPKGSKNALLFFFFFFLLVSVVSFFIYSFPSGRRLLYGDNRGALRSGICQSHGESK